MESSSPAKSEAGAPPGAQPSPGPPDQQPVETRISFGAGAMTLDQAESSVSAQNVKPSAASISRGTEVPVANPTLNQSIQDDDAVYNRWKSKMTDRQTLVIEDKDGKTLKDDHGLTEYKPGINSDGNGIVTMINLQTARNIDLKHEGRHVKQLEQAQKLDSEQGTAYMELLQTPVGRAVLEMDAYAYEKSLGTKSKYSSLGDEYNQFLETMILKHKVAPTPTTQPIRKATPEQKAQLRSFLEHIQSPLASTRHMGVFG
jgi:hypothetical protein